MHPHAGVGVLFSRAAQWARGPAVSATTPQRRPVPPFLRTFVTVVMAHLDGPRRYLPMRICLSQIASAIGLTSIRVLHLFIRLNLLQRRCCTRVLFELLEWPTAVFRIKHGCFRCMLFHARFTYGCFHARYSILLAAEYYHTKQIPFVFLLLHHWPNHYQPLFGHELLLFSGLYRRMFGHRDHAFKIIVDFIENKLIICLLMEHDTNLHSVHKSHFVN